MSYWPTCSLSLDPHRNLRILLGGIVMKPSMRKREPLEIANGQRMTPLSTIEYLLAIQRNTLHSPGSPYGSNPAHSYTPPAASPMPQGQYTDPPPPKSPAPMLSSLSSPARSHPCYLFNRGTCHYGKFCKFWHVLNLLGPPPQNILQSQERAPESRVKHDQHSEKYRTCHVSCLIRILTHHHDITCIII